MILIVRRADFIKKLLLRSFFGISVLAAPAVPTLSKTVEPCRAAVAARAWYELRSEDSRLSRTADGNPTQAIGAESARRIVVEGLTIAYAFDLSTGGCIAIAADDELPPILYYSLRHRLAIPAVPPAQAILESFARKIGELRDTPCPDADSPHPLWSTLLSPAESEKAGSALRSFPSAAVGPLLTSTWHQREPYNLQCPTVEDEGCPVGCTALAMAQIMRYWEWPETGDGNHWYYWSTGKTILSADFASTTYDWGNMPDQATSDSPQAVKDAVSTLCYHCGVSIDNQYSPYTSTGGAVAAGLSLARYFGYGYARVVEKSSYDDSQWYGLVCEQIGKGQPILCSIMWGELPHTVVLDGHGFPYLVHLNMGWGGDGDGWYLVGELPKVAVIDIRPHERPMTYHVNAVAGEDTWDGTAPAWEGGAHGPKKSIRAAIDALSGPEDTVIVADGLYTGEDNKELPLGSERLIGNTPLTVRSANGPSSCIIDCQGAGRAFFFSNGIGEKVEIAGFTIRNGQGGELGGAIYSSNGSPTISNCIIYGNSADRGGAVYCIGSPGPTFSNCVIGGNFATYGGAICGDGASSLTVANCVIYGNVAESRGGGLCWCDGSIRNCIIRGNTAPDGAQLYDSCESAYSCIGGWTEESDGNIDRDPLFVDPDGPDNDPGTYEDNNYRLSETSPCIDAGDNSALNPPGFDSDGNLRIAFGGKSLTVDMGAYEYGSGPFAVTEFIQIAGGGFRLTWNSQPNDMYFVWSCSDLGAAPWIKERTLPSHGSFTTWTDVLAPAAKKSYKIQMVTIHVP